MPIKNGLYKGKSFYAFGPGGKKYYYIPGNKRSRTIAKNKSLKQGRAMHANK